MTTAGAQESTWTTMVRGLRLSPELRTGLAGTVVLACVATAGRVVVPIAVQQVLDRGLGGGAPGAPVDLPLVWRLIGGALVALVATGLAGWAMNVRLSRISETALSNLRVRAFRHLHDLSALHQAAEHRGSLVARVTSDVDTISRFMQWGGVVLLVSVGQLLVATAVMAVYSLPLTLVVLATSAPLVLVLRRLQRRLVRAHGLVRTRVAELLSAVAEAVVGVEVVRAYGMEARSQARVDAAVDQHVDAGYRVARTSSLMYGSAEVFAAMATAGAIAVGVVLGVDGALTAGRLLAFLFLVWLFVGPVQVATEVLDQAQTAVAGWRRVLDLLDVPADVADPASRPDGGRDLPPGPLDVAFRSVRFAYPSRPVTDAGGPPSSVHAPGDLVLRGIDLRIEAGRTVAVVGETGSGKSTFAKLAVRLLDPTDGQVLLGGTDLADVRFSSLRRRVAMVPQDGFLFAGTIADNVRRGRPGAADEDVLRAFADLGLDGWLAGRPGGLATEVGERGQWLSAGERQLVALARAAVAEPDLLVLDEATSSVDPATEAVIGGALERLTTGRTTIAIAHRLSTAERADEVLVFDAGQVVQRGPHAELVAAPGVYRRLHDSWRAAGAIS